MPQEIEGHRLKALVGSRRRTSLGSRSTETEDFRSLWDFGSLEV